MKKVVISNSMLKSLNTCETQAWLRTKGYGLTQQEPKKLRAGTDAHLAFEAWLNGASVDDAVSCFRQEYGPYSDSFLLDKDAYHVDNLARILSVFFAANPLSAMPFEVVETEKQIEHRVLHFGGITGEGTDYIVTDKPDGKVRMKDTGDLLSLELKTTGHIGEDYLLEYALDSQITTHVAASRAAGDDVKGVLLQIIQFNRLPDPLALTPKTKKPLRCRVAGHGYQRDCWSQHVRWERFALTRTADDIEVWEQEVREDLLRYERLMDGSLQEANQKGIYGACGRCDFLRFCQGQRRDFSGLIVRERSADIMWSGVYNDEADEG